MTGQRDVITSTVIIKEETFKKVLAGNEGDENTFRVVIPRTVIFESGLTRKENQHWKGTHWEIKEFKD